jgi:hypothetical protein
MRIMTPSSRDALLCADRACANDMDRSDPGGAVSDGAVGPQFGSLAIKLQSTFDMQHFMFLFRKTNLTVASAPVRC